LPLQFCVSEEEAGERLDRFLVAKIADMSRSAIQKLIEKEHVTVNGRAVKVGERLRIDDQVSVVLMPPAPSRVEPQEIPLNILFEDDDILVLNKPAGLVVHPAAGNEAGTLVNGLLYYDSRIAEVGGEDRPGIVHRLDKGTSGVIVVARSERARLSLVQQFKDRSVIKQYWALAHGVLSPTEGSFESSMGRHPEHRQKFASIRGGKPAHTDYVVLRNYGGLFCEVRLRLHTGRTHQIRVHMSEARHPIIGDKTYGGRRDMKKELPETVRVAIHNLDRPALHAASLVFSHPVSGQEVKFEAPLPSDLKDILKVLQSL